MCELLEEYWAELYSQQWYQGQTNGWASWAAAWGVNL